MTHDAGSRPTWPEPSRRNILGAVLGAVIIGLALLALLFFTINNLLVDRLWFESQGQLPVWDLRTFGRILLWYPGQRRGVHPADPLGLARGGPR